jgi:hypothetical protein
MKIIFIHIFIAVIPTPALASQGAGKRGRNWGFVDALHPQIPNFADIPPFPAGRGDKGGWVFVAELIF